MPVSRLYIAFCPKKSENSVVGRAQLPKIRIFPPKILERIFRTFDFRLSHYGCKFLWICFFFSTLAPVWWSLASVECLNAASRACASRQQHTIIIIIIIAEQLERCYSFFVWNNNNYIIVTQWCIIQCAAVTKPS